MPAMRSAAIGVSSEVISGILNCVCPDCSGSMGGAGKEFKCRGECQTDWRPALGATLIRGIPPSVKKAITLS
jgi:tRNA(Ile2) C34 agmatinyltransferase TiaS